MKENKFTRIALVECDNSDYVDVIEGPKEILDNLKQYLGAFYEYAERNYFGDWCDYDKTEHLRGTYEKNYYSKRVNKII